MDQGLVDQAIDELLRALEQDPSNGDIYHRLGQLYVKKEEYRTAADYANAPPGELEEDIRSTGFFRNKAKSLTNCGAALVEKHQAEVPDSLEELVKLPGIGRKTANVILGTAFNTPGIVVDTHVGRISQRIGLTQQRDPVKIEFDLMELIPQEKWTLFSHQLIQHGRKVCKARKPKCTECPLLEHCDFGQQATMATR